MAPWTSQAACRGKAGALFTVPAPGTRAQNTRNKALTICRRCPVQRPCLETALANPDQVWNRVAGGLTHEQRTHVAAARDRAQVRLTKPQVAAAYTELWEGRTLTGAPTQDPARKEAARHMAQDQAAARMIGQGRLVEETARCSGPVLRDALAAGDAAAVRQVLDGLPAEHRSALLVEFAAELGAAA
ncbi:WhiB family transcriptional regulator [Nocardiopsis sp. CT-R113]|uniref:WhiB family transcriptional regulator n=1 Tax=Nocardiopsis codii TaxID=3065942 RepID=A0ABU7KDY3_9ACTN|nr:WhiB family transcriptional regulator [Nocardiopsis sp. CT-R113]MEE2040124.1 WhiB family transcriptional regulator [Nocardiopsis sp. CT-R113]